jgi:hypothetical protein
MKIACDAERHLAEAAFVLTQQHDPEGARDPLTSAAFATLGYSQQTRAVVNLLLRAMVAQRDADQREIAGWRR